MARADGSLADRVHLGELHVQRDRPGARAVPLYLVHRVLYHNPEQLRMIRRLWDLLKPGGVLVLESAVTRRRALLGENCVEIISPPSEAVMKKYHLSLNITHLPSSR